MKANAQCERSKEEVGSCATTTSVRRGGKGAHWVCVLDGEEVVLSRRVEATEEALGVVCSEIPAVEVSDERVVGIDQTGDPAALMEAVLLGREGALHACFRLEPVRGPRSGAEPTLPTQAVRGEGAYPSRDCAGEEEGERPLGDVAKRNYVRDSLCGLSFS